MTWEEAVQQMVNQTDDDSFTEATDVIYQEANLTIYKLDMWRTSEWLWNEIEWTGNETPAMIRAAWEKEIRAIRYDLLFDLNQIHEALGLPLIT